VPSNIPETQLDPSKLQMFGIIVHFPISAFTRTNPVDSPPNFFQRDMRPA
jgi:hypothetical protein